MLYTMLYINVQIEGSNAQHQHTNYQDTTNPTRYLPWLELLWSCDIHAKISTYKNIAKLLTHPCKCMGTCIHITSFSMFIYRVTHTYSFMQYNVVLTKMFNCQINKVICSFNCQEITSVKIQLVCEKLLLIFGCHFFSKILFWEFIFWVLLSFNW